MVYNKFIYDIGDLIFIILMYFAYFWIRIIRRRRIKLNFNNAITAYDIKRVLVLVVMIAVAVQW